MAALSFLGKVLEEGELLGGRVEASGGKEEVLVEILEVKSPRSGFVTWFIPDQEDAQTRVDEELKHKLEYFLSPACK